MSTFVLRGIMGEVMVTVFHSVAAYCINPLVLKVRLLPGRAHSPNPFYG